MAVDRIVPLSPLHERALFSCGVADIDDYLGAYNFDHLTPAHRIFVAVDADDRILGYYSLRPIVWNSRSGNNRVVKSSTEIELAMLGVLIEYQSRNIVGPQLILDAYKKCRDVVALIGGVQRLWVGPLNQRCRRFYENAGFTPAGDEQRMFITMDEVMDALAALED